MSEAHKKKENDRDESPAQGGSAATKRKGKAQSGSITFSLPENLDDEGAAAICEDVRANAEAYLKKRLGKSAKGLEVKI